MDHNLSLIAMLAEREADAIIGRWQQLLVEKGATGGGRIKEG